MSITKRGLGFGLYFEWSVAFKVLMVSALYICVSELRAPLDGQCMSLSLKMDITFLLDSSMDSCLSSCFFYFSLMVGNVPEKHFMDFISLSVPISLGVPSRFVVLIRMLTAQGRTISMFRATPSRPNCMGTATAS